MRFSQRKGLKPAGKLLQAEGIDAELRNGLWSCYFELLLKRFKGPDDYIYGVQPNVIGSNMESLFRSLWLSYFKRATDTMPDDVNRFTAAIRDHFFDCEWYEVYDFMEFTLQQVAQDAETMLRECWNAILQRENAGYRVLGEHVVDITNEHELAAIDEALTSPVAGARQHLQSAIALMSDRKKPDYRNSIKESISAVEAVSKAITADPKATLGVALNVLQSRVGLHGALKAAPSSLYGYTSDEQGIRHAMLDEPTLRSSDAKFMLVACSAFVNYVISKAAEANVGLE